MNKIDGSFKDLLVEILSTQHGNVLAMNELKVIDENTLVVPISAMISTLIATPMLSFAKRGSALFVEARELVYLGSPGSLMNCVSGEFVGSLLCNSKGENSGHEMLPRAILSVLANAYLSIPHTTNEFLASVIQASNANTFFTSAIKNHQDGEIYVRAYMACDFESIPKDFEKISMAVLAHAFQIRRFVERMHRSVLPDTTDWDNFAATLLSRVSAPDSELKIDVSSASNRKTAARATL